MYKSVILHRKKSTKINFRSFSRHRFRLPEIIITNMTITQSVEAPLTTKDTVEMQGNIENSEGVGAGTLTTSYRRVMSHRAWAEVCTYIFRVRTYYRVVQMQDIAFLYVTNLHYQHHYFHVAFLIGRSISWLWSGDCNAGF